MTQTSPRVRAAAAAVALLFAGHASAAGTFTPEVGFGSISGKHVIFADDSEHHADLTLSTAFGYEWDNGFGARAVAIGAWDIQRDSLQTNRTFDNFVGVEGTGKLPLNNFFNLRGALGVGRTHLEGHGAGTHGLTDGIVSAGLQCARPGTTRWSCVSTT